MPYTRATILEIQRISNVVPVDSRTSTETTKVGSYVIPKVQHEDGRFLLA